MSEVTQESMSERELAEDLASTIFSGEPKSVGEALDAADEPVVDEPLADEPPIVVSDEPVQDTQPDTTEAELEETPAIEEVSEDEEGDTEDDPNVIWATKRFGPDTAKWAKVARDQETQISRLAGEKKEMEDLAGQWYEYAQSVETQAQTQMQSAMPLSSAEENWIEQAMMNPVEAARQAAYNNNVSLYNGVIARVAEENPMLAGQIGAQVQMEMQALASQQVDENGSQQPSLADAMGHSIVRLGIDLNTYGPAMSAKIEELGEFHPYVETILGGQDRERDLALMAVYDLVRSSALNTRKVRSDERDEQIRHEAELRKQASGVVTGGPVQEQTPKQSTFLDEMEQEWRDRGQWHEPAR